MPNAATPRRSAIKCVAGGLDTSLDAEPGIEALAGQWRERHDGQ
jgi:hypothetical protein